MNIRNILEERFKDVIINALHIEVVDESISDSIKDMIDDMPTIDLILILNKFSELEGMHKFRDEFKKMNNTLENIEIWVADKYK
jgi:hypothetical protein